MSARASLVARTILVAVGVLIIGFGAYTLHATVRPTSLRGLGIWILAAIILHDVVLAPFVVGVGVLLRRVGRVLPAWTLVTVQSAVALAAVLAAVVLPEIDAKHHVQRNPTVVPFDYSMRLGVVEGVLAVIVVVVLVVGISVSGRRTSGGRPSKRRAG